MQVRRTALAVLLSGGVLAATPALAHQTVSTSRATVTFHATPDDEPVAGQPSTLTIVAVKPRGKGSRFTFGRCRCRVRIADSAGRILRNGRAGKRTTFTFPAAAAYEVTVSGRYRTAKREYRRFSAKFALRATEG